jgi:phosphatidate cytidylyltransferase
VLHRRLLSAFILIASSLFLIGLDLWFPIAGQVGVWMIPLYIFMTLGTATELSQLLAKRWPIRVRSVLVHCILASTVTLFPIWYSVVMNKTYPVDCPVGRAGWLLIGVLAGVGSSGLEGMWRFGQMPKTLEPGENTAESERTTMEWMLSSFVITYVVGCLSFWFLVRMQGSSLDGMLHLIALLAIIKFADAGAYFAGKSFGRHKLIPAISPGKTIEGLIGGMLLSIFIAYFFLRVLLPWCGVPGGRFIWGPALLGCFLTLIGLVGDLLESMVKRTVGAKDSGALLPGLGGVWDVTDSLLPSAIVGYLGIIAKLT